MSHSNPIARHCMPQKQTHQIAMTALRSAAPASGGFGPDPSASPGFGAIRATAHEAVICLAPIYNWFTEGCQTIVPSETRRARMTFAGSTVRTCRRSFAPLLAQNQMGWTAVRSVAALGLHGLAIRIRVSRVGVSGRLIRRGVQDCVAARRVFTRSRRSG
jgi:hypothetical protein